MNIEKKCNYPAEKCAEEFLLEEGISYAQMNGIPLEESVGWLDDIPDRNGTITSCQRLTDRFNGSAMGQLCQAARLMTLPNLTKYNHPL